MPAKDHYHDTVVRALSKDGWIVTDEQFTLVLDTRHLWVDLRAENRKGDKIVLIEIKGFETKGSIIEYLMLALGQYVLYNEVVKANRLADDLYLAIPVAAYESIFAEDAGKYAIMGGGLQLLVFDPATEEIILWIP